MSHPPLHRKPDAPGPPAFRQSRRIRSFPIPLARLAPRDGEKLQSKWPETQSNVDNYKLPRQGSYDSRTQAWMRQVHVRSLLSAQPYELHSVREDDLP